MFLARIATVGMSQMFECNWLSSLQVGIEYSAVIPHNWCHHIELNNPVPHKLDCTKPCEECGAVGENWVCLTCYKVTMRLTQYNVDRHSLCMSFPLRYTVADMSMNICSSMPSNLNTRWFSAMLTYQSGVTLATGTSTTR